MKSPECVCDIHPPLTLEADALGFTLLYIGHGAGILELMCFCSKLKCAARGADINFNHA